ncbi:MAG TPA: hypothetical protein VHK88_10980, partial [Aquihabitans sp.]|nr:hypothetical protein [Aquihabitans sp.]
TAGGRTVRVVLDEEVRIGADGAVRSELRPLDRPFRSYADYRSFLAASFAAVVANASDGRRAHPLTPLPSISAGYDSAAIAVLASEVGIDRALTMLRPEGDPPVLVDHPGVLAEVLGIELVGVERGGWRDDPSMPEALVAASGVTFMDVVMLTYRDHLPGALLVVGHSGDNVWSAGNFRAYQDVVQGAGRISGRGLAEHRLEVGYVLFAPATAGHTAHPSIFRLSGAAEMSPWDVGGSYNRPIARRIVEEAGVPRGSFATRKFAGSGRVGSSRTSYRGHDRAERAAELAEVMTPAGVASFLDHVDALAAEGRGLADARVRRRIAVGRVGHRLFEKLDALNHHVGRRLHRIGIKALVPRRVMIRAARHVIVHPDHTYLLAHWGTSVCAARHLADGPLLGGSTDPVNPAPEALLPS